MRRPQVGDAAAAPSSAPSWQAHHGANQYGRNFKMQWLKLCDLPFSRTQHLANPYNDHKPVKVGNVNPPLLSLSTAGGFSPPPNDGTQHLTNPKTTTARPSRWITSTRPFI
eukprot:6551952-Pyramimonas_sp.AAC.1